MEWMYLVMAYFCGSIPFGLILTHLGKTEDIRTIGSGNIGATNVLRTGKVWLALCTLIGDIGKGLLPVIFIKHNIYFTDKNLYIHCVALLCVIGHIYPCWLRFQGGKGVATALGVFFGLNVMIGFIAACAWLCVFYMTRYSSLASIVAMGAGFVSSLFYSAQHHFLLPITMGLLALLVIARHKSNIIRLLNKTEPASRAPASHKKENTSL